MREDDLKRQASRGDEAQRLMAHDLVADAFARLEAEYQQAWRETGARDVEARERLWQAMQIVGRVREHLRTVAANGSLARHELDRITKLRTRKSRGLFENFG